MRIFNAVSIEHTLARFFGGEIGDRLTFYDADVLRSGDPKDLAEIIRRVADRLDARIALITFPEKGSRAKTLVQIGVSNLRNLAEELQKRRGCEREDYHWEIFGALMKCITGLLEALEAQAVVLSTKN